MWAIIGTPFFFLFGQFHIFFLLAKKKKKRREKGHAIGSWIFRVQVLTICYWGKCLSRMQ
jgi:hypothetical protein